TAGDKSSEDTGDEARENHRYAQSPAACRKTGSRSRSSTRPGTCSEPGTGTGKQLWFAARLILKGT
ncbi:MAG: hypothetical protein ACK5SL_07090, partial [Cyclobacteriaceae bacterium]